jgi:hypothetical protein
VEYSTVITFSVLRPTQRISRSETAWGIKMLGSNEIRIRWGDIHAREGQSKEKSDTDI